MNPLSLPTLVLGLKAISSFANTHTRLLNISAIFLIFQLVQAPASNRRASRFLDQELNTEEVPNLQGLLGDKLF